jgi:hypothetical protein
MLTGDDILSNKLFSHLVIIYVGFESLNVENYIIESLRFSDVEYEHVADITGDKVLHCVCVCVCSINSYFVVVKLQSL